MNRNKNKILCQHITPQSDNPTGLTTRYFFEFWTYIITILGGVHLILAYLWTGFLIISLLFSWTTDSFSALTPALLKGAEEAVTLCVSLAGPLCLWSGLTRLMETVGASRMLASLLRPILGRIFPQAFRDETAAGLISANVSANFLGLGNAATPSGIAAVQRMHVLTPRSPSQQRNVSPDRPQYSIHPTAPHNRSLCTQHSGCRSTTGHSARCVGYVCFFRSGRLACCTADGKAIP